MIVLAWVNDEDTLRAYGSKTDAYETFKCMLESGTPPDNFVALMQEAADEADRFEQGLKATPSL